MKLKEYLDFKDKVVMRNPLLILNWPNFDTCYKKPNFDLSTRLLGINPTNSIVIHRSLVLRSIVLR